MQTRACLLNMPSLLGATAYQLVQAMLLLILEIVPWAWEKFWPQCACILGAETCEYHGAMYCHACMTRVNDELKCSRAVILFGEHAP